MFNMIFEYFAEQFAFISIFNSQGVTILLSLTVFLNMVAETMPATSDVSIYLMSK